MAGRFNGLTDIQWEILQPLMPKEPSKRPKGKPHTPWRKVCNTIFWIMITGSRWVDLPIKRGVGIKIGFSSLVRSMAS